MNPLMSRAAPASPPTRSGTHPKRGSSLDARSDPQRVARHSARSRSCSSLFVATVRQYLPGPLRFEIGDVSAAFTAAWSPSSVSTRTSVLRPRGEDLPGSVSSVLTSIKPTARSFRSARSVDDGGQPCTAAMTSHRVLVVTSPTR